MIGPPILDERDLILRGPFSLRKMSCFDKITLFVNSYDFTSFYYVVIHTLGYGKTEI